MSNFSVNATYYLRNAYAPNNRTLITEASRKKETNAKLSQADSNALKKAIRALEDYDYKKDESEVSSAEKTRFDKELRAFIDTYNYSMESSSKSSNRDIKKAGKNPAGLHVQTGKRIAQDQERTAGQEGPAQEGPADFPGRHELEPPVQYGADPAELDFRQGIQPIRYGRQGVILVQRSA